MLAIGLMLAACGGGSTPTTGSGASSAAPPGGQSVEPAPSTDGQSAEPVSPSASAEPPPSQGGGGTGSVPVLTSGDWTSGTARADVSGDVSGTIDANLLVGLATTDGDATQLTYISTDSQSTIAVAINGSIVSISVTNGAAGWTGGGGTTEGAQCSATFTKGDATSVAGTVTCDGAPVIDASGAINKTARMVVTFEAKR